MLDEMIRVINRREAGAASRASIVVVTAFFAVGCGGAFDASLSGTVTLDGDTLPTGTLTFKPVDVAGSSAYAQVDESGEYEAKTGREQGLPAGDYLVTVVARQRPDSLYGPNGGPPPPGKMITPEWYRSTDTSGLAVTVEPGHNDFNIELTSEPPTGWQPKQAARRGRR